MLSKEYIEAMKIGYIINRINERHEELRDELADWTDSEEISQVAENIIKDNTKENNIENPDKEIAIETVLKEIKIINKRNNIRDHGYDDINRGVIAGMYFEEKNFDNNEILMINKAELAETLWNDMRFHYYQDVCQYVNKDYRG